MFTKTDRTICLFVYARAEADQELNKHKTEKFTVGQKSRLGGGEDNATTGKLGSLFIPGYLTSLASVHFCMGEKKTGREGRLR